MYVMKLLCDIMVLLRVKIELREPSELNEETGFPKHQPDYHFTLTGVSIPM